MREELELRNPSLESALYGKWAIFVIDVGILEVKHRLK